MTVDYKTSVELYSPMLVLLPSHENHSDFQLTGGQWQNFQHLVAHQLCSTAALAPQSPGKCPKPYQVQVQVAVLALDSV